MRLKHKIRNFLTLAGTCFLSYAAILCFNILGIQLLYRLGLFGQMSTIDDWAKLVLAQWLQIPILLGVGSIVLFVWLFSTLLTALGKWWND